MSNQDIRMVVLVDGELYEEFRILLKNNYSVTEMQDPKAPCRVLYKVEKKS